MPDFKNLIQTSVITTTRDEKVATEGNRRKSQVKFIQDLGSIRKQTYQLTTVANTQHDIILRSSCVFCCCCCCCFVFNLRKTRWKEMIKPPNNEMKIFVIQKLQSRYNFFLFGNMFRIEHFNCYRNKCYSVKIVARKIV